MKTAGIHHITAIVGDPQENIDFYQTFLGLRLVKQTINFDDTGTYHLYFGDDEGTPGTIMTFFPWQNAKKGTIGAGQVGTTRFAIPVGSYSFWQERLDTFAVPYRVTTRFNEQSLSFTDPHGLQLELTESDAPKSSSWSVDDIPATKMIVGFAGAVLLSASYEQTNKIIEEIMGFSYVGEENQFLRFQSEASIGNTIDIWQTDAAPGSIGVGMVHHIAFRAKDDADQLKWKQHVESFNQSVTPVQPRQYFNAIYFREPGGILFEIATDPPGFTHDEAYEQLGKKLMLPEWYEPKRAEIENALPTISLTSKTDKE
ncbi:glyoxalase family protein [Alkalihalobacillus xiaoxiensis]|uniref:Glyoxalase family protein n=1 Tax=Shouchella xiaoxiensis TaxID=766895 RepID=A0ABS2SWU2_9BACI|nr:ring-cleaving dioxygenase [Shouchella xiaoxiensis]MBM7838707.1 glyoxalase family protein [Shouchella xiaoxiensis]